MWQTKYASAIPKNLGLGLNIFCRTVKAISYLGVRSPRYLVWSFGHGSVPFKFLLI